MIGMNLFRPAYEPSVVRFFRFPARDAGLQGAGLRSAALAGAVVAALAAASPALAADVAVSPDSAVQGDGANLTFRVTNDHATAALTAVRLDLPADVPVAEVYPLSVPDWAPRTTSRTLNPPVPGLHGGTLEEATASITWTAAPSRAIPPGASAELGVALGPMPSVSSMTFTVRPSHGDGSAGPATEVTVRLTPPPGADAALPADDGVAATDDATLLPGEGGPASPSWAAVSGWLVAAVCASFAVIAIVRARRDRPGGVTGPQPAQPRRETRHTGGSPPDDSSATVAVPPGAAARTGGANRSDRSDTTDPEVTVPAGTRPARVTTWSYRDGS